MPDKVIEFTDKDIESLKEEDVLFENIQITEPTETVRTVTLKRLQQDVQNAKDDRDKWIAELAKRESLLAKVITALSIKE